MYQIIVSCRLTCSSSGVPHPHRHNSFSNGVSSAYKYNVKSLKIKIHCGKYVVQTLLYHFLFWLAPQILGLLEFHFEFYVISDRCQPQHHLLYSTLQMTLIHVILYKSKNWSICWDLWILQHHQMERECKTQYLDTNASRSYRKETHLWFVLG